MFSLSSSQLSRLSPSHFQTQTGYLGNSFPEAYRAIILLQPSVRLIQLIQREINWFPGSLLKHHGNVSKYARVISLWSHIHGAKQTVVFVLGSRCHHFGIGHHLKPLLCDCNWDGLWQCERSRVGEALREPGFHSLHSPVIPVISHPQISPEQLLSIWSGA